MSLVLQNVRHSYALTEVLGGVGLALSPGGVLALVDRESFYVYAYFMETKLPAIKVGATASVKLMAGDAVERIGTAIEEVAVLGDHREGADRDLELSVACR